MPAAIGDREPNGQEPGLEPGSLSLAWFSGARGVPHWGPANWDENSLPSHFGIHGSATCRVFFFDQLLLCVLSCPLSALPRCWDISSGCYPNKIGPAEGPPRQFLSPSQTVQCIRSCNSICRFSFHFPPPNSTWRFQGCFSRIFLLPCPCSPPDNDARFALLHALLPERCREETTCPPMPPVPLCQAECNQTVGTGAFSPPSAANQGASRVWQTATDALPDCWEQHLQAVGSALALVPHPRAVLADSRHIFARYEAGQSETRKCTVSDCGPGFMNHAATHGLPRHLPGGFYCVGLNGLSAIFVGATERVENPALAC